MHFVVEQEVRNCNSAELTPPLISAPPIFLIFSLLSMANGGETQTACGLNLQKAQRGPGNDDTNLPLIVAQNVNACNGIIHGIDEVMLPRSVSRSDPPPAPTTSTNESGSDSGEIVNIVGQLVYGP